ncbi:MAG: ABC transporter permease [Oscillospiraceae bacterium]|nr:ABC transporter permease [Oscillospiraceae bacterium]
MSKDIDKRDGVQEEEHYSLNDDRRVKVLSPGRLVAKRFFRNRLAVVGLTMLVIMFLFSFVGGWIVPYSEDQFFYTMESQKKEYAGVTENTEYRYLITPDQELPTLVRANLGLVLGKDDVFQYKGANYHIETVGEELYQITNDEGTLLALAFKDIINPTQSGASLSYEFSYNALMTYAQGGGSFQADGKNYDMTEHGVITENGQDVADVGRVIVQSRISGRSIPQAFKDRVAQAIENHETEFTLTVDGQEREYTMTYDPAKLLYSVMEDTPTQVYDKYAPPSRIHLLGTEGNGMDVLTRLMYGGRVSLIIGFIVIIIETSIGVVMGGISGYFGSWVDNLIMRIVDIFYCIPSMPLMIILGSAMDAMRVDPQIRMLYLMLLLGFLGWPGIARLVRGQILSLREQEFMTATEATGLSVKRRIFCHLIPNVIPQLIVNMTMGLGSIILTEATLSYLGLGVKFPFASWGNIINEVNNSYVLTEYLWVWIPAGVCLLVTVLGFNFVGDGLRDAFDPKMKR